MKTHCKPHIFPLLKTGETFSHLLLGEMSLHRYCANSFFFALELHYLLISSLLYKILHLKPLRSACLLYTSDAADEQYIV